MSIGDIVQARSHHATLSVGVEHLPCLLSGESFKVKMIIKVIESRRLIDKQGSFDDDNNDNDNASIGCTRQ